MNYILSFACNVNTWLFPTVLVVYIFVALVVYGLGRKWRPDLNNVYRLVTVALTVTIVFYTVKLSNDHLIVAKDKNPNVCNESVSH
jgi:surface polysaccharide O-acyltransferase-like enzyme